MYKFSLLVQICLKKNPKQPKKPIRPGAISSGICSPAFGMNLDKEYKASTNMWSGIMICQKHSQVCTVGH